MSNASGSQKKQLLTKKEVCALLNLGSSTWSAGVEKGIFPRPTHRIGESSPRWTVEVIIALQKSLSTGAYKQISIGHEPHLQQLMTRKEICARLKIGKTRWFEGVNDKKGIFPKATHNLGEKSPRWSYEIFEILYESTRNEIFDGNRRFSEILELMAQNIHNTNRPTR